MRPKPAPKPPSRRLLAAALALILIGALFQVLRRDSPATGPALREVDTATPATNPIQTPRREPSLPFELRAITASAGQPEALHEDEARVDDEWNAKLEGPWHSVFILDPRGLYISSRGVTVRRDGDKLVFGVENDWEDLVRELTIDGRFLTGNLDERFGGGELRGTINPALDRIEITGTARYDSIEPADSLRLVLVRRPDEHVEHEAQLEQYYIDLGNVVDAIASYARKNDDRLPPNLEALVPEYLTDDTRFARSNERIITYDPSAVPVPGFLQYGWAFSVADVDEMFVREAELERFWQPGFLASRPLLVAEYPADGIVYEAVSMLDVYVVQSPEFPGLDVLQPPPRTESSWQSKCAQQIGQIAKGAKGFQKQHLTNRFPPGLHTLQSFSPIFREFFTCPSVEPGTLSYALAFPAANDDELDAIYHAVAADATAVDADRDATLPLVVELHPCAGGYARHVAYLNGEVELLTPDEWRARVEPFLNAAP